ncbi:RND family efflux transporter MFP subunit [Haloferula luteola]|uniref:RND family efflux transporter MFP subunit n=1 Tax=Haloferula luteola TaxID=595692 RepID=A0A840UWI2_9BACT|nr:efflux RND transporter periplasmic adaptor subunit [Haloferula luteola]MBB5350085.1 RND family efflux transporter MFP subunit [Haloferula luteola]
MLTRIIIPILVLCAGAFFAWRLSIPEAPPEIEHVEPQKLKTEIVELESVDFPVLLDSQGVVRAHHETPLTPTISGTIVAIHSPFEDGAFFKKGDILAELDPADYTAALESARSRLAQAEAALAQEDARARQARLNWEDLGYEEAPSDLVLRVPQLKEARANVDAAKATLDQASRDLDRTKIRAPFDGRVRQRLVGLGQAVGASTELGTVFATDFAEIRLPLTPAQLGFIDLPAHEGDPAVPVTLVDALGETTREAPTTWSARIVRTEGTLDPSSRELFVIARIDDPFGLHSDHPPLRIAQPVRASIVGHTLHNVFVIPRNSLRGVNVIYLVDPVESAIVRQEIDPIWSTATQLVVDQGLENGQWLAITRLPYAPNGAPVQILDSTEPADIATTPEKESADS